jgi:hypothetical protein
MNTCTRTGRFRRFGYTSDTGIGGTDYTIPRLPDEGSATPSSLVGLWALNWNRRGRRAGRPSGRPTGSFVFGKESS